MRHKLFGYPGTQSAVETLLEERPIARRGHSDHMLDRECGIPSAFLPSHSSEFVADGQFSSTSLSHQDSWTSHKSSPAGDLARPSHQMPDTKPHRDGRQRNSVDFRRHWFLVSAF